MKAKPTHLNADLRQIAAQLTLLAGSVIDRPLLPLAKEFREVILARGRTIHHARTTHHRIIHLLRIAKITRLGQLAESPVQRALGNLRTLRTKEPMSLGGKQHHWRAVTSFSRWLKCSMKLLATDPLENLPNFNPELDPRRRRHVWTDRELRKLVAIAAKGKKCCGMTGNERAALYGFLADTALRPGTVKQLTRSSLILGGASPHVVVQARQVKDRKPRSHPLRPDTAERLARYLANRPGGSEARLFPMPSPDRWCKMLRVDLAAAKIPTIDAAGGRYDLYSLRHTAITRLVMAGTPMPITQALAGHSSMEVTRRYYVHVVPAHLSAAINALPRIFGSKSREKRGGKAA